MANSFIVRLAVELGLKALALNFPALAWLFTGVLGNILGYFMEKYLGLLADKGILLFDLTKDSIQIALQRKEYREAALKAYVTAKARVYTEKEKNAIRKQYLEAIRKFATVGDGLRAR